ncbi:MAG: PAS domain-containing sensor histidine kinase [OM182 bacterium]|nr:MAG: PAS domain-containing sensor histidine kinase [OM182 bacterium]
MNQSLIQNQNAAGPNGDQSVLGSLVTAVITLDQDLYLASLNPAAESLLHVSANFALGKPLHQLVIKADPLLKALKDSLRANQPFTLRDIQLRLPDSLIESIDLIVTVCDQPRGLLLEMHPTSRLNLITQNSSSEEQQLTTRSLIRGLAHEVKNPLGGIRGAAQLLERALPSEALREYTQIIIAEADRLRDLVDQMLGPWQPMQFDSLNILEVLEHVAQLLGTEHELTWIRDYDPSLPPIQGSRDQLVQAILNIVSNACEAMIDASQPRITLRTRVVRQYTIGGVRHRQILLIEVHDNGPGIPSDLIDRIFFPMISGKENGSGLGLAISQNIISQHGGTIQVVSVPGNTTFSIFLPFSQAQTQTRT